MEDTLVIKVDGKDYDFTEKEGMLEFHFSKLIQKYVTDYGDVIFESGIIYKLSVYIDGKKDAENVSFLKEATGIQLLTFVGWVTGKDYTEFINSNAITEVIHER